MPISLKREIELRSMVAVWLMSDGMFPEARQLLREIEADAKNYKLEDSVRFAEINLATSHQMEATLMYEEGAAGCDPVTKLLPEPARSQLEAAAGKFGDAYQAYTLIGSSFVTAEEIRLRQRALEDIFLSWADAYAILAKDALCRGNEQMSRALATAKGDIRAADKGAITSGLATLDTAVRLCYSIIEVCDKAGAKGVQMDEASKTIPVQTIEMIRVTAAKWASDIGRQDLAQKYLKA